MDDVKDAASLNDRLDAAAQVGMTYALWAQVQPDKVAIYDPDGTPHTFGKVNANANKLARLFRQRGIKAGDSLALSLIHI